MAGKRWSKADAIAVPPPVFTRGVRRDLAYCPRCTALLVEEPAFLHCRACGRLYPIRGADYSQQAAAEAHSHPPSFTATVRTRPAGRQAEWQK